MFGLDLTTLLTCLLVLTGLFVAYKQWIQGPKIDLNIGDTIDLVRSTNGKVEKKHLTCSFHNTASRTGVVSKIVVIVLDGKSKHLFNWLQIYEYTGGHVAKPKSKPYPIPVIGRSTAFEGIEFITDVPLRIHKGTYKVVVLAWWGGNVAKSKPFLRKEYEFTLDRSYVTELSPNNRPGEFFLVPVPLSGMQLSLGDIEGYLKSPGIFGIVRRRWRNTWPWQNCQGFYFQLLSQWDTNPYKHILRILGTYLARKTIRLTRDGPNKSHFA